MAWFESASSPLSQLGQTIGYSPNGAPLPSVQASQQAQLAAAYKTYFDEERRRWNASYQQKQDEIDKQYNISKKNARTAQQTLALDDWYKRESAGLARERLAQDKYEFEATNELNRAKLGYDVLGMAAQLRGPENYFQAANYARGVSGQPETATFLNALQNQTKLADYGAQGGLPNPETLNTLTAKLTGVNSAGNAVQDGNNRAVIGNIAARGAHQLAPGSWESLTDTERKLFTSGLDDIGIDTPTFLQMYARSRPGQGIAGSRAA